MPCQSGTARRGQFGLVYQVAGAESSVDYYHDELAQLGSFDDTGTDYMDHSGNAPSFDGDCTPGDSEWGYFPPTHVLAARSKGMSNCWGPNCGRVHMATYRYALCSKFQTFEAGSCRCEL